MVGGRSPSNTEPQGMRRQAWGDHGLKLLSTQSPHHPRLSWEVSSLLFLLRFLSSSRYLISTLKDLIFGYQDLSLLQTSISIRDMRRDGSQSLEYLRPK